MADEAEQGRNTPAPSSVALETSGVLPRDNNAAGGLK
jgi:hypothetical protein